MSLLLLIVMLFAPPTEPPAEPEVVPSTPERVHLIVDRYEEISGFIEEEDENLITIRDVFDKASSYPKSRILRIVRLLDVSQPTPGIVFLRDGTALRGTLLKDSFGEVVLEIEGIRSRLPRSIVHRAEFDLTLEQKYERFKASIDPEQYLRRFDLARWLFQEERYDLAQKELIALVGDSQLPDAIQLLRIVEAQLKLNDGLLEPRNDPAFESTSEHDGTKSGTVSLRDMLPKNLLTEKDVNIIRVYEIDFDRPPKMHISPDSIREILEMYGDSKLIPSDSVGRTRLFRAEPLEVVKLLFDLHARDLYSRIDVQTEPPSLNLFRQRVHDAWLIPNCATSRCHGGLDAGRLFLHRHNHKRPNVRYTNMLILERWDETERPLIDYDKPEDSLLLQYALPRKDARFPHPDVKGFRPIFTRANQRLLRDSLAWIRSMYRPRPRYPVSFEAPVLDAPDEPVGDQNPGSTRRDR